MKEFALKYGCNPNQKPASIYMADGSELPVTILNGRPGYINFLDALNSYQLVKELKEATGKCAVTSFKHVSPTSAAIGKALPESLKKACFVDDVAGLEESPLACAYARARDPISAPSAALQHHLDVRIGPVGLRGVVAYLGFVILDKEKEVFAVYLHPVGGEGIKVRVPEDGQGLVEAGVDVLIGIDVVQGVEDHGCFLL